MPSMLAWITQARAQMRAVISIVVDVVSWPLLSFMAMSVPLLCLPTIAP